MAGRTSLKNSSYYKQARQLSCLCSFFAGPEVSRACTLFGITMMHKDRKPVTPPLGIALVFISAIWLTGCQGVLFSPTDERSQFDRYDRVRNNYAPLYVEDEFGRQTPNLRGRLAPKK